jgi:hypothetical protein
MEERAGRITMLRTASAKWQTLNDVYGQLALTQGPAFLNILHGSTHVKADKYHECILRRNNQEVCVQASLSFTGRRTQNSDWSPEIRGSSLLRHLNVRTNRSSYLLLR